MSYRKLKINQDTWEYTVGKDGVKMRSPDGRCTWVKKYILHGFTKSEHIANCQDIFDADDDYAEIYPTGPGDIRKYIEENLMEKI